MIKKLNITEAVELSEKFSWFKDILSIIPNNLGINLCAVDSIEFECEDDDYGQLTSLRFNFITCHDKESLDRIEANGGPFPMLKKDENEEVIFA